MNIRPLIGVLFAVSTGGCASTQLTGTLPELPDPDQAAEFYVIRTNAFAARVRSVTVGIDGNDLFTLQSGKYTRFLVPADEYNREHSVLARGPGGEGEYVSVLCEPGVTYYFLVDTGIGAEFLKELTESEATEWLAESEYVELGRPG